MSVQITFEPDGGNGLVAEGTLLWQAAKRLGVSLPAQCKGRGECDSCAVLISSGADLLSPATSAEEKMLGQARLSESAQPERLACQAILQRSGEIIVRLSPVSEGKPKSSAPAAGWSSLPLKEKLGSLIELEAITITEALNSVRGGYHALVEKFLNLSPQTTKAAGQTTKDAKQAPEQNAGHNQQAARESKGEDPA